MPKLLVVPMYVDALCLDNDQIVASSTANFSQLPFNNGHEDFNYETPYISEAFLSTPFQDDTHVLPAGLHIHWAIPASLTNGQKPGETTLSTSNNQSTGNMENKAGKVAPVKGKSKVPVPPVTKPALAFRDVPDRWMVIRSNGLVREKVWIVESNYLYPADATEVPDAITFPDSNFHDKPFRYMGRSYQLPSILPPDINKKDLKNYVNGLKALGHGDPAFAAFYPNCHSAFGFHDKEVTSANQDSYQYEVYGWYSENQEDPLKSLAKSPNEVRKKELYDQFNWKVSDSDDVASCTGIICYGRVDKDGFVRKKSTAGDNDSGVFSVAVGNSGAEALTAFLTDPQNFPDQKQHEEKLESLQYLRPGDQIQLDKDKIILQAMHEKGFLPVDGGSMWVAKVVDSLEDGLSQGKKKASTATSQPRKNSISENIFSFPATLATLINEINELQQACDKKADIISSKKQQLYSDWYKYMVANYHNDLQKQLPEADLIRYFIEKEIADNLSSFQDKDSENKLEKKLGDLELLVNSFNTANTCANKKYFNGSAAVLAKRGVVKDATLAGLPVLVFNGSNKGLNVKATGAVNALSAWINISQEQPNKEGCLFQIVPPSEPEKKPEDLKKNVRNAKKKQDSLQINIGYNSNPALTGNIFINGVVFNPDLPFTISNLQKDQWLHIYIVFSPLSGNNSQFSFTSPNVIFFNNLKGKLAGFRFMKKPLTEGELFYDLNMLGLKKIQVSQDKAPRYWQPNEPVVLISGNDMKTGARDSTPLSLDCCAVDFPDFSAMLNDALKVPNNFDGITTFEKNNGNWNPCILQWQVIVEDHLEFTTAYSQDIDESYIINHFNLDKPKGDFTYKNTDLDSTADLFKEYTGSTMLSDHAKTKMQLTIANYLLTMTDANIEIEFGLAKGEFPQKSAATTILECRKNWKKQDSSLLNGSFFTKLYDAFRNLGDTNSAILDILKILNTTSFLSQALGGFNAALLQFHQSPQFPIKDPVGFTETKSLTDDVLNNLTGEVKNAPLPLNPFNPIRTGALRINQLSILDNFGQRIKVHTGNTVSFSKVFTPCSKDDVAFLPPRIVQPVRLNFRWLSAANELANEVEMNSHPASTPVCGWLVANNLDHSIMVYNANGYMLGIIKSVDNSNTQWTAIPGKDEIKDRYKVVEADVENDHMQKVVNRLLNRNPEEFESFMELIEETLDQIDPADFAQHTDLAMLMSKPVAVVRCSLNLEIKGLPAVNQGWDYFDADLESTKRTTNNWEKVQFPVYVGEPGMLNDGVLGYWNDADADEVFKSVHTYTAGVDEKSTWYEAHKDGAEPFILSVSDEKSQTFTMLFDPRGLAHAVSGIVPSKSITIPADQYKPAIEKMSSVFFTRPLLMPAGEIVISLPDERGYLWSWVSEKEKVWQDVSSVGVAEKNEFVKAFGEIDGSGIWKDMTAKGWIAASQSDKALINPSGQWVPADVGSALQKNEIVIREMFDRKHIIPINRKENFSRSMEAKEGWLKLTVTD